MTSRDAPTSDAAQTVARVAREAYGRLIAILAKRTGDITAAEDALADAFATALSRWEADGVPTNPESWLLTVARNRDTDRLRSSAHKSSVAGDALEVLERRADAAVVEAMNSLSAETLPDERLKLMFVCAHPAIDEKVRTPLMLQTVLGLDASTIASAFATPASAMAQRLVRAKKKIKQAGIPFAIPDDDALPARLESVHEAIYGAYATHWLDADQQGAEQAGDLRDEALYLADLLVRLMPLHAEGLGLASLLWFSQSRSGTRLDGDGCLVPLSEQDTRRWDRMALARGTALLNRASALKQMGRFQLEAAIQSVHADRARTGHTDWHAVVQLYEGLLSIAPTLGAAVAHAAAVGEAYGAEAGLGALDRLGDAPLASFQPAWATRAHLLSKMESDSRTYDVFSRALELTHDRATRLYLEKARANI